MAINFPSSPVDGFEYTDSNSGTWVYDKTSNSWSLKAAGNVSPFDYKGDWDFASATAPSPVKSGDIWTHGGADGATINAVYTGMSGTIAAGQMVLYDGAKYVKVGSTPGYPNTGDGNGATLDDRYLRLKGRTSQTVEGSITASGAATFGAFQANNDKTRGIKLSIGGDNAGVTVQSEKASSPDNSAFQVLQGNDTDQTFAVKMDGEVKAANGNTEIQSDGAIRVKRSTVGGLGLGVFPDNDFTKPAVAVINTDGSATFKGDVAVGESSSTFRDKAQAIALLTKEEQLTFSDAIAEWNDVSTLPADPGLRDAITRATTAGKINLNADDGSITAAGDIHAQDVGGLLGRALKIQSGATWGFRANPTDGDNSRGLDIYRGSAGTDVYFSITRDGDINAPNSISSGLTTNGDVTKQGAFLFKEGGVYAMRPEGSTSNVFAGYQLGNATPTASISADGNIYATGDIHAQDVNGLLGRELKIQSGSTWGFRANPTSGDNSRGLDIYRGSEGTDVYFSISRDGEITAAGGADAAFFKASRAEGEAYVGGSSTTAFTAAATPGGANTFRAEYDGTVLIGGTLPAAPKIELNADGSITAKGDCLIGDPDINTSKILLNKDGSGSFQTVVQDSGAALQIQDYQNISSSNYYLRGQGSVLGVMADTFKVATDGTVTADNVTFNLEPEDENNYTVTEEEYEEIIRVPVVGGVGTADLVDGAPERFEEKTVTRTREVREYTGPVMDVRETIQSLLDRATKQDAVIEDLTKQLAALKEAN